MKNILNIMFCIIVGIIVIDGLLNGNSTIIAENKSNKNIIITPAKTLPRIEKSKSLFFSPAKINSVNSSYVQKIDMDKIGLIESSNNPNAISKAGARGQYQIMRGTWSECTEIMGLSDKDYNFDKHYNDPIKNRKIGEFYMNNRIPQLLHWNFHPIKDSVETRLAAYNCGINVLSSAIGISLRTGKDYKQYLPQETQDYIKKYKDTPLKDVR